MGYAFNARRDSLYNLAQKGVGMVLSKTDYVSIGVGLALEAVAMWLGFFGTGSWKALAPIILGLAGLGCILFGYLDKIKRWHFASNPLLRNSVYIIGTLVLILVVIMVYSLSEDSQIKEKNIRLALQFAYEWDKYKGSTNEPLNMSRIIDEPIMKEYTTQEMRLLLGVDNDNKLSLEGVRLSVFFEDDTLKIRHDDDWQVTYPGRDYFVDIGTIPAGKGYSAPSNLWIRFPGPGIYKIKGEISGGNFMRIDWPFEVT